MGKPETTSLTDPNLLLSVCLCGKACSPAPLLPSEAVLDSPSQLWTPELCEGHIGNTSPSGKCRWCRWLVWPACGTPRLAGGGLRWTCLETQPGYGWASSWRWGLESQRWRSCCLNLWASVSSAACVQGALRFHFTGREELCCCWFRFLEREEFCPESLFLVCLSANETLLPNAPAIPQTCQVSQLFPPESQNYSLPLPGRLACLVCLQTVLWKAAFKLLILHPRLITITDRFLVSFSSFHCGWNCFIGSYDPCRRRQWHPTPVLLPGKSHGWRSLVGCSPWGRTELDTTEVT